MNDIEARILKLEVLFESYSEDLTKLTKKIDNMANDINEIKRGLYEGNYNDKKYENLFGEVQNEIDELRQNIKTLEKFMWWIVGALAVIEFIFRYLIN